MKVKTIPKLMTLLIFLAITNQAFAAWVTKAPLPSPTHSLAVAVVNDTLYAIGGMTENGEATAAVYAYAPATDTWVSKAAMPTAKYGPVVGVVNNIIYVVGGSNSNSVDAYDPATDTWATGLAPFIVQRGGFGAGVINSMIYIAGGYYYGGYYDTAEEYNPETNSWALLSSMTNYRTSPSAGVIDDKLYIFGGQYWSCYATSVNEEYDPETGNWTNKAPMSVSRGGLASGIVNNEIMAVGGHTCGTTYPTAEAYDPFTDKWTDKAPMPTPRTQLAVGVINNILYAVGGFDYSKSMTLATVEALVPDYVFSGFFAPLNLDKPFKLGSTIPVKFQLADAFGNYIPSAVAKISLQKFSNNIEDGLPIVAESTSNADTGNTFRYSSEDNQYIFNLNTKGLTVGTWQIRVALDDGNVQTIFISLKK